MTIKPLICSPSPRDIPEVRAAWDTIHCDRYLAKYFDEKQAYEILRDYFLDNKEYTHMVICPDDLVVTKEVFDTLMKNVTMFDFPVLAGICNLDWQQMDTYSCCQQVSGFQFFKDKDLHGEIIRVGHEAFACSWIRRDVIEQIELNGVNEGHHFDWAFSLECAKRMVPIHVDTSAKMLHLKNRLSNGTLENSGVGIKQPMTVFEKGI
jgi:hypothetical protein